MTTPNFCGRFCCRYKKKSRQKEESRLKTGSGLNQTFRGDGRRKHKRGATHQESTRHGQNDWIISGWGSGRENGSPVSVREKVRVGAGYEVQGGATDPKWSEECREDVRRLVLDLRPNTFVVGLSLYGYRMNILIQTC